MLQLGGLLPNMIAMLVMSLMVRKQELARVTVCGLDLILSVNVSDDNESYTDIFIVKTLANSIPPIYGGTSIQRTPWDQ